MGVEWNIGCLKCKKYIWLGSQKPFSWKGFQIGAENVKKFLLLHSECSDIENLLLANDSTINVPWEIENSNWKEDILSRTFCFDSLHQGGIHCAFCSKNIEHSQEKKLKISYYLWFCDKKCFNGYLQIQNKHSIYNSTDDYLNIDEQLLNVSCNSCKAYVIVDDNSKSNFSKKYENLALFLCEHIGHDHLLKANVKISKEIKDMEWNQFEY